MTLSRRTVVGLIADTHGQFRPDIPAIFSGVDFIVHAGDVGPRVLEPLRAIAPVFAVSGNVDDRQDPMLPRDRTLAAGDLTIHVSHGDELGSPRPDGLFARYDADIIVYGHTHKALFVRRDDGRICVNPGAAGPRRFNLMPSVAILTVEGRIAEVRFVELETRSG